jgi:hypothetical protein
MLRLPKVATVCLVLAGMIALAPAGAFARGGSHGGGGHFGGGAHGHFRGSSPGLGFSFYPYPEYYPDCVWMRRLVRTPHGPRWRRVPVC